MKSVFLVKDSSELKEKGRRRYRREAFIHHDLVRGEVLSLGVIARIENRGARAGGSPSRSAWGFRSLRRLFALGAAGEHGWLADRRRSFLLSAAAGEAFSSAGTDFVLLDSV